MGDEASDSVGPGSYGSLGLEIAPLTRVLRFLTPKSAGPIAPLAMELKKVKRTDLNVYGSGGKGSRNGDGEGADKPDSVAEVPAEWQGHTSQERRALRRNRRYLGQFLNAFFVFGGVLWALLVVASQGLDTEPFTEMNPWWLELVGVIGFLLTKFTPYQGPIGYILTGGLFATTTYWLFFPFVELSNHQLENDHAMTMYFCCLCLSYIFPLMFGVLMAFSSVVFCLLAALPVVTVVLAQILVWDEYTVVHYGLFAHFMSYFFCQALRNYFLVQVDTHKAIGDSAKQASSMKSQYLANITHELRTPLNGMIGLLDLLKETELNTLQEDYLSTCTKSCEELIRLVNELLDIAKIEEGKLVLEPTDFDMSELIVDTLDLLSTRVHEGVELLGSIDSTLPDRIISDPGRIRQMLTNFLGNAIKFTTSGHILVKVTVLSCSKDDPELNVERTGTNEQGRGVESGSHSSSMLRATQLSSRVNVIQPEYSLLIQVSVEDTGMGVSKEDLGKLFQRFQQANDPRARALGTGLGLSISKQLAEIMGGDVGAESDLGKGSRFWFTFRAASSFPLELNARSDGSESMYRLLPHVAIVHSDAQVRGYMSQMLYRSNYRVSEFATLPKPSTSESGSSRTLYVVDEAAMQEAGLQESSFVRMYDSPLLRICSLQGLRGSFSMVPGKVSVMRKPITNMRLQKMVDLMSSSVFSVKAPQEQRTKTRLNFGKSISTLDSAYGSLHQAARLVVLIELRPWISRALQHTLVEVAYVPAKSFVRSVKNGGVDLAVLTADLVESVHPELPVQLPLVVVSMEKTKPTEIKIPTSVLTRCVGFGWMQQPMKQRQHLFDDVLGKLGYRMGWLTQGRRQSASVTVSDGHMPLVALHSSDAKPSSAEVVIVEENAGFSVMVVDDNPVNRKLMQAMLGPLCDRVLLADSGREAIAMYKRVHSEIDLMFLDCQMPDIDGFSAARAIRQFEIAQGISPITIVALTADGSEASRAESQVAGMDLYVTKPVRKKQLRDMIEDYKRLRAPSGLSEAPGEQTREPGSPGMMDVEHRSTYLMDFGQQPSTL